MQYRRLGQTEIVVSEVGLGTWTLAADWWGEVADKTGVLHAALDAGITFIDTAPVYGEDGFGETMLADVLKQNRDALVITTKCGYDLDAPRKFPGQSERPHDWRPEAVRGQLEASLRRLGTDYIDLYQLHNVRMDPMLQEDLWEALEDFRREGKVRELGVALGPAIGWVEEGLVGLRDRNIATLQTVFNILEQEPGLTFAAEPAVTEGRTSLIARVPHASDALNGRVTRDTVFPPGDHRNHRNKDNMADNFDKAERLGFLHGEETGRTLGQAAIAGILAYPGFATVLPNTTSIDEVREFAAASDMPFTAEEKARVDELFAENFGIVNRYEMPLKSSV